MRLHRKAELVADFVFELLDPVALEFDDLPAILADDVIVPGTLRVIRVVKLVLLPKIHFPHQPALRQQRQGPINGRARNRLVAPP